MALSGWNINNLLKLTIDSSKIDTDLTNFPVNITLSSGTGQSAYDATAVFDGLTTSGTDSYIKLLLHMDDTGLSDNSDYNHTTTLNGTTARSATQSKFGGYSAYFPGDTGSYLSLADNDDWYFDGDFTIDFWIRSDGTFGDNGIFGTSEGGGGSKKMGCYLDSISGGSLAIHKNGPAGSFNILWAWNPSDDTWYHVAIVRNGSSWYLFVNGVQTGGTQTQAASFENVTSDFRIGTDGEAWKYFKGFIDEFRISKGIARWTSNFTPPGGSYRSSSWWSRKKIAITDSNDNQLYTEIESWDFENEEAVLWTKVPTITSGTDTTLYLYYDSSQSDNTTYVGDTGDSVAQNVWDDNFVAVYHMAQDPNGDVADAIKDSTSNTNHGTPGGSMTTADLVDGKVGKGIEFDGDNDKISNTYANDFSLWTVEGIFSFGNSYRQPLIILGEDGNAFDIGLITGSTDLIGTGTRTDAVNTLQVSTAVVPDLDTFYHIVSRYDGTNLKCYINTVDEGTEMGLEYSIGRSGLVLGYGLNLFGWGERYFDGIIDEMRISDIDRSAAWIKATYYSNCNDLVTYAPEYTYYYSGYVTEQESPVARIVRLYYRNTGELVSSTTSSGVDGYYYLTTKVSGEHFIVAFDDYAGETYNALILDKLSPIGTV